MISSKEVSSVLITTDYKSKRQKWSTSMASWIN